MAQALVQTAGRNVTSAGNSQAFASNVTAGNLLVVFNEIQGASTTCTSMSVPTDTLLNAYRPVWASIQSPAGGTVNKFILAWYCISAGSGANTVTTVSNAGGTIGSNLIGVAEFSGFPSGAILDQVATAAAANAAAVLPISLTTTLPNSIIFGFTDINTAQTAAPVINSPYILGADLVPSVGQHNVVSVYALAPTTGTYALSGTWDTNAGNTRVSFGFSIAAVSTPTFIQTAGSTNNGASPLGKAFTSNNALGNLLVCIGRGNAFGSGTTITDSQGNTWVKVVDNNYLGGNNMFMAYALNCKAGANTVTVTQPGGLLTFTIAEYSGVGSFDTSTSFASNSATPGSGNITTAQVNELLIGGTFTPASSGTLGPGSGYTLRTTTSGTVGVASLEDKFTNAAGTNSAAFTVSTPSTVGVGIMAFKSRNALSNLLMMMGAGT